MEAIETNINQLPDEILLMIFKYLPDEVQEVKTGKFQLTGEYKTNFRGRKARLQNPILVCRRWRQVIESNFKFHCTFFESEDSKDHYQRILDTQKKFQSFHFSNYGKQKAHLYSFQRLLEVNRDWVQDVTVNLYSSGTQGGPSFRLLKLAPDDFFSLILSLQFLQKLKLIIYHVSESSAWNWSQLEFSNLRQLEIYTCFNEDKTLAWNFLKNFEAPNLEVFNIGMVSGIMPELDIILEFLNDSQNLKLFQVTTFLRRIYWDPETLELVSLTENSVKLKDFLAARLDRIKNVSITNCSGVNWYQLLFESKLGKLESLLETHL